MSESNKRKHEDGGVGGEGGMSKRPLLEEEEEHLGLIHMPDEILLEIFSWVDGPALKALGFTCSRFTNLVRQRQLWINADLSSQSMGPWKLQWYVANTLHEGTTVLRITGFAKQTKPCLGRLNRTRTVTINTSMSDVPMDCDAAAPSTAQGDAAKATENKTPGEKDMACDDELPSSSSMSLTVDSVPPKIPTAAASADKNLDDKNMVCDDELPSSSTVDTTQDNGSAALPANGGAKDKGMICDDEVPSSTVGGIGDRMQSRKPFSFNDFIILDDESREDDDDDDDDDDEVEEGLKLAMKDCLKGSKIVNKNDGAPSNKVNSTRSGYNIVPKNQNMASPSNDDQAACNSKGEVHAKRKTNGDGADVVNTTSDKQEDGGKANEAAAVNGGPGGVPQANKPVMSVPRGGLLKLLNASPSASARRYLDSRMDAANPFRSVRAVFEYQQLGVAQPQNYLQIRLMDRQFRVMRQEDHFDAPDQNVNYDPVISQYPIWPKVTNLHQFENPSEVEDETIECNGPMYTFTMPLVKMMFSRCPNISELYLEYCSINFNTVNLSMFPRSVKVLSLCGTIIYNIPSTVMFLHQVNNYLPLLEILNLSECDWLKPDVMISLSKLQNLKKFIAADCKRLTEFIAYASLATKYGFRKLELADFSRSPVGDSEVSAMGWLPNLTELYLQPPGDVPEAQHYHYYDDPMVHNNDLEEWEREIPQCYAPDDPSLVEEIVAPLPPLHPSFGDYPALTGSFDESRFINLKLHTFGIVKPIDAEPALQEERAQQSVSMTIADSMFEEYVLFRTANFFKPYAEDLEKRYPVNDMNVWGSNTDKFDRETDERLKKINSRLVNLNGYLQCVRRNKEKERAQKKAVDKMMADMPSNPAYRGPWQRAQGGSSGGPSGENGGPSGENGGPSGENGGPSGVNGGPSGENGGPSGENAGVGAGASGGGDENVAGPSNKPIMDDHQERQARAYLQSIDMFDDDEEVILNLIKKYIEEKRTLEVYKEKRNKWNARPKVNEGASTSSGGGDASASGDDGKKEEVKRMPVIQDHTMKQMCMRPIALVTDYSIRYLGRSEAADFVNIAGYGARNHPMLGEINVRPNKTNLRVLVLRWYTGISNGSLSHLSVSAPHLAHLDVRDTSVTRVGVEHFRFVRPDVDILYNCTH